MATPDQLLHPGVQVQVISETPTASGSTSKEVHLQSDTVLVTLFATSVTTSLDVSVYALTDVGKEVILFSFPQLTSGTANLLLKRASIATSRVRIAATYVGACSYEIYARAVQSGLVDTRISGADSLRMSQKTITTGAAQLLVAAALTDRSGIVLKNWNSTSGNLFIGAASGEATTSEGYPLAPRDALAVDLAAGVSLWATSDSGSIDVRISESGS